MSRKRSTGPLEHASGAKVGGDSHDRDIRMTVVKGRQRGVVGSPVLTNFLGATASTDVGTGGVLKAVADEGWWNGESTADSIWWSCLRRLNEELTSEEFHAWIRPLQPRSTIGRLELLAPNRYVRERVEDVYLLRIAELVADAPAGTARRSSAARCLRPVQQRSSRSPRHHRVIPKVPPAPRPCPTSPAPRRIRS